MHTHSTVNQFQLMVGDDFESIKKEKQMAGWQKFKTHLK
jgi:hypothetical protein